MKRLLKSICLMSVGALLFAVILVYGGEIVAFVKAMNTVGQSIRDPGFDPIRELANSQVSSNKRTNLNFVLPVLDIRTSPVSGMEPGPLAMDMNGDGLLDLAFSQIINFTYTSCVTTNEKAYTQYVLLNSGNGFRVAYSCSFVPPMGQWTGSNCSYASISPQEYRGTCAQ